MVSHCERMEVFLASNATNYAHTLTHIHTVTILPLIQNAQIYLYILYIQLHTQKTLHPHTHSYTHTVKQHSTLCWRHGTTAERHVYSQRVTDLSSLPPSPPTHTHTLPEREREREGNRHTRQKNVCKYARCTLTYTLSTLSTGSE